MTGATMTSYQRVTTALAHREPDRVPFFMLLTVHGAKELGLSIKSYYSRPDHVAEGQLRMRAKYRHDCLYAFYYAAVELEAWGGEVLYFDDGSPNAGAPIVVGAEDVLRLQPPKVADSPALLRVLETIRLLRDRAKGEVPIIGVVMSPFSLAGLQMGFGGYIELVYERPDLLDHLMRINEEFCAAWANAQMEAGATALCYFDPMSSPTVVPRDTYLATGFQIARRTIARIRGPVVTHMASGRCIPILDDLAATGTVAVAVSAVEDLREVKNRCAGKLGVVGNLNALEMRRWTLEQTRAAVRETMASAGAGGGFILCDNHGEIPWQVPESILMALSDAVHDWGWYPLRLAASPHE